MSVEYFTGFEHGGSVSGIPFDISTGDGSAEVDGPGSPVVEIVPSGTFAGPHVHGEHSLHINVSGRELASYSLWNPDQYGSTGIAVKFEANPLYLSFWVNFDVVPPTFMGFVEEMFLFVGGEGAFFNFGVTIDTFRRLRLYQNNGSGVPLLLDGPSSAVSAGWRHVKIGLYEGDTQADNWYKLFVDGVEIFSGSNNAYGDNRIWLLTFGKKITMTGSRLGIYFDDVVVCNNDFLPTPHYAVWMDPASDGTHTANWDPLSGSDLYAMIDERPWDGDTSYNASSTADAKLSVNVEAPGSAGGSTGIISPIHAVRSFGIVGGVDPSYVVVLLRSNGVDSPLTFLGAGIGTWVGFTKLYNGDFGNNDIPWTIDSLGQIEVGAQAKEGQYSTGGRVTQSGVTVLFGGQTEYDGPITAHNFGG